MSLQDGPKKNFLVTTYATESHEDQNTFAKAKYIFVEGNMCVFYLSCGISDSTGCETLHITTLFYPIHRRL